MEGNNSERTRKILNDPDMRKLYIDYILAKESDKEKYEFELVNGQLIIKMKEEPNLQHA